MSTSTPITFTTNHRLRLRRLTPADLPALTWLAKRPNIARLEPLTPPDRLETLIACFPQAQLAVELDHRLIGALAASPTQWSPSLARQPWQRLDVTPSAPDIDPVGPTLRGAGALWLDVLDRDETTHLLTVGRQAVVQQLGLDETVSFVRASSWADWRDSIAPQAFVQQVHAGGIADRALGAFIDAGWVVRGFRADGEHLEVLLRWKNRAR